jgi:hypothetical protein
MVLQACLRASSQGRVSWLRNHLALYMLCKQNSLFGYDETNMTCEQLRGAFQPVGEAYWKLDSTEKIICSSLPLNILSLLPPKVGVHSSRCINPKTSLIILKLPDIQSRLLQGLELASILHLVSRFSKHGSTGWRGERLSGPQSHQPVRSVSNLEMQVKRHIREW